MIALAAARRLLDPEILAHVLSQDRHHHDDSGAPWWETAEALDEAIELAEIELAGEEVRS
jgi:hypothetical protein